ncbi:beta-ketoacyl-ACP synthase, partial [Mesorhizobium sp. M7A.F.Ca.CA.001.10.2.1]
AISRGRKSEEERGKGGAGRERSPRGELDAQIAALLKQAAMPNGKLLAMSGASGAHTATIAEKAALDANPAIAARGFSTLTGHMKEAQFPFAVALAALAVDRKAAYPVFDAAAEKPFEGVPATVLATAIGYHQFEGMALVNAA